MNVVSLGFRTDLMLLEMGGSVVIDRSTHMVVRTPANPGYWWGNCLVLASPLREGDAEHWTREFAEYFPDAGHLALGVDGTEGEAGDAAELTALGVTVETNVVLTAEHMPAPGRTPSGVDVRPLSGDDDWEQAAEVRWACDASGSGTPAASAADSANADSAHRAFVEEQQAVYRRLCEAGYGAWFGAFVDGRMRAGAGLFTDGSGLARYQSVETHPEYRRRGLASALVQHAGHWATTELRATTLVIVADPDHHAIALYRNLGFTETERQVQLQRGA